MRGTYSIRLHVFSKFRKCMTQKFWWSTGRLMTTWIHFSFAWMWHEARERQMTWPSNAPSPYTIQANQRSAGSKSDVIWEFVIYFLTENAQAIHVKEKANMNINNTVKSITRVNNVYNLLINEFHIARCIAGPYCHLVSSLGTDIKFELKEQGWRWYVCQANS
jgi:hypothetical protein